VATAYDGDSTDQRIEARLDRLETRRGRYFNALTALITALATLGAVWLGSALTAEADDARADEDFAREQRIETYGEFLGSIDTSYALMGPFLPSKSQFSETPLRDFAAPTDEQYAEIVQSLPLVRTLSGRIDVIGGKDLPGDADQLATHLDRGATVVRAIYRCHNQGIAPYSCNQPPSAYFLPPVTPKGVEKNYFDFFRDREAFLRDSKTQLALPE
jgi:hypothetical protein